MTQWLVAPLNVCLVFGWLQLKLNLSTILICLMHHVLLGDNLMCSQLCLFLFNYICCPMQVNLGSILLSILVTPGDCLGRLRSILANAPHTTLATHWPQYLTRHWGSCEEFPSPLGQMVILFHFQCFTFSYKFVPQSTTAKNDCHPALRPS